MKRNYLIVCLTLFIWGSLYVAGKYAFVSIPPVTVLLFRNLIGIVPLGCLAWKSGWKKVEKKHIKVFVLFGLNNKRLQRNLNVVTPMENINL